MDNNEIKIENHRVFGKLNLAPNQKFIKMETYNGKAGEKHLQSIKNIKINVVWKLFTTHNILNVSNTRHTFNRVL